MTQKSIDSKSTAVNKVKKERVKNKPTKEELKKLIDEKGYRAAGEKYGVADNTVRRWLLAYGVELEPKCVLRARDRRSYEKVGERLMCEEDIAKSKGKKLRKKNVVKESARESTVTPVTAAKDEVPEVVVAVVPSIKPVVRIHPVVDMSKIKNRYSPTELADFEVRIRAKIQEGFEAICVLKSNLTRSTENGTDDTAASGNAFEEGTASIERENMTELLAKKQKHLNALNAALVRIGNGTYGICVVTGNLIPKERLLAVPHATKCLEAKRDSDNGKVVTPVESDVEVTEGE